MILFNIDKCGPKLKRILSIAATENRQLPKNCEIKESLQRPSFILH